MPWDWDIIFKIGSSVAFVLVVKDVWGYIRQPALSITFDRNRDLRHYTNSMPPAWTRRVGTLHIKKRGRGTAKRCVAIMKIMRQPHGITHTEDEYAIHWADVDYSASTDAEHPIEIGIHRRRLDVVFTEHNQNMTGSWVAVPFTLSGHLQYNQAYLPPGEYEVEVEVMCENGKGDVARLLIVSPTQWDLLHIERLDVLPDYCIRGL